MQVQFGRKRVQHHTLFYLAGAAVCFWFASPRWVVPVAAWIGPWFVLRFMRQYRPLHGMLIMWLVASTIAVFANNGFVPLPLVGHLIFTPIASLVGLLPYLLDRLISPRMKGFASTLVLPLAWTTLDYAQSFFFNGTIVSPAYTQANNLALIQIAAVTGVWGITFLLFWFGSVANWVWEQVRAGRRDARSLSGAIAYASIMLGILSIGAARLWLAPMPQSTVQVAGISVDTLRVAMAAYSAQHGKALAIPADFAPGDPALTDATLAFDIFVQHPNDPRFAAVHTAVAHLHDELFTLSRQQARAGAKVIAWSEASAWVLKPDEPALIERAQQFAREERTYLYMPILSFTPGIGPFTDARVTIENKIVTIGPDGAVLSTYVKTKLPVGERAVRGDGRIPIQQTPLGVFAAAICYDLDTPSFVRQVGQAGVGLMLAPANDWKAATPWHPQLAKLRAIENGFALMRPVSNGLFIATDQYGRTLGTLDYFSTVEHTLAVTLPTHHVPTVYARIGDSFAWLSAVSLACLASWVLAARLRFRRAAREVPVVPQV